MEQLRRATARPKQWMMSPVFGAAALENLYGINRIYVESLTSSLSQRPFQRQPSVLPDLICDSIAQLKHEHRRVLADSPFSLFDARWGDGSFWSRLTQSVHEVGAADREHGPRSSFTELALFYAWHLARADSLAARILLGMSGRTQATFLALPLPQLQQLAAQVPDLIRPRWADRGTVWQILLGAACRGADHMKEARMFGIQLIAGDLSVHDR